jgi:hypothetical protein
MSPQFLFACGRIPPRTNNTCYVVRLSVKEAPLPSFAMLKLHIVLDATLVGAGEMNIGKVSFEGGQPIKTEWEPPIHVSPGDIFNIPQGYRLRS